MKSLKSDNLTELQCLDVFNSKNQGFKYLNFCGFILKLCLYYTTVTATNNTLLHTWVESDLCVSCSPCYPECSCSPDGSMSDECDTTTGQCLCRPHFHGLTCDVCSKGYWKPALSGRCQPCSCDPTKSYSDTCDQVWPLPRKTIGIFYSSTSQIT